MRQTMRWFSGLIMSWHDRRAEHHQRCADRWLERYRQLGRVSSFQASAPAQ